ncbi:hypothetical protein [Asanoa ishikariensis]|uniref:hypothetical protein n=1 Tax=Asanoa ishikariensis TaxID=137265 RepID=UPI00115FB5F2|nr:hypothetical protein [Asanoa ishikariensis]
MKPAAVVALRNGRSRGTGSSLRHSDRPGCPAACRLRARGGRTLAGGHDGGGRGGLERDRGEDRVRGVLTAAAGGQGQLEVAAGLDGVVVRLGADALRVLPGLGQHLAGLGDDLGGLFLGQGDHLLHPVRVAVDGGARPQHLVQALGLGADHPELHPHGGGALSLRGRAGELLAQVHEATFDLVAVVPGFDDGEVHH